MATRQKKSITIVGDKISQLKQAAIMKGTRAEIKQNQLTLFDIAPWSDDMRAIPNDLARTALFTVRHKSVPRAVRENHPLFVAASGVVVTYTGIELRAENDELVWQQVLEYAKRAPVGAHVEFTFFQLCQDLGWSLNGRYYERVEECLRRLQATALQFVSERLGRLESVSLIHRFSVVNRATRSSRCRVEIDGDLLLLFAGEHYSRFIWEKYRKLSPIARRLFDYFVSHRHPYPIKLETFRLMCGSDNTLKRSWSQKTKEACTELNESGLIKTTWVEKNLVCCER